MIDTTISVLFGYLAGSLPFAYIITKMCKDVDIRTLGSGNPGATNVYRTVGKFAGALTLVCDLLKGLIPAFVIKKYLGINYAILTGFFAIIGHTYTVFMGFKGGKGIATSAGVFLAISPISVLMGLAGFLISFLITKIISISSIAASITLFVGVLILNEPAIVIFVTFLAVVLVIYRHKPNIKRLIEQKEPRTKI